MSVSVDLPSQGDPPPWGDQLNAAIGVIVSAINALGSASTHDAADFATASALAALTTGAPSNLNSFLEVATALNSDPAFYTTITGLISAKASTASPTLTGDPKAPTPSVGDNDTSIATTAFVTAALTALLASPTFTGDPKAPTPSPGDNDTSIATTAFVAAAIIAAGAGAPTWATAQAGSVGAVFYNSGTSSWPARPTSRTDVSFIFYGPLPGPGIITSGTAGMYSVDSLVAPAT